MNGTLSVPPTFFVLGLGNIPVASFVSADASGS